MNNNPPNALRTLVACLRAWRCITNARASAGASRILKVSTQCIAVVALCFTVVACSSNPKPKKPQRRFPNYGYQEKPSQEMVERLPWEVWQPFQDLQGGQLSNESLILGDELQQRGKRQSALDAYLKVDTSRLEPVEAEAAVIRIASQHLALDQPKKALSSIGSFFKRSGKSEGEVSAPFALVLAFAYGRHGDFEQSLAWFSKASALGRPGGPAAQTAATGTSMLLRTLSADDFERISGNWRADTFISGQFGKERFRRASPGYDQDDTPLDVPFWTGAAAMVAVGSGGDARGPRADGNPSIGLVLSLSERFGALGRDTKQGFELAVEANNPKVRIEARDVGADTAGASAAVRELVAASKVSVVAGPLLTEAAVSAAQTAQELGVPMISFSKSESFRTGGGIFRLGATTTSQVDALINSAFGDYGISRYAVAYPQSGAGSEFLEGIRKKLGQVGLSLELEVPYSSSDDASLMEVAQRLEGSSVEAVIIPDSVEVSERLLRQLSPGLRKRIRPLGTALWDNATKIARSQALFERALFVSPFFAQSTREEVQRFIESYRSRYKVTPNFLAAQGFDAGTLITRALTNAENSGGTFESALLALPPYNGVTGAITAQPSGEVVRSFYVVEVLRDSFQEKIPPSNPSAARMSTARSTRVSGGGTSSTTPVLGSDERVDSGY